MKRALAQEAAEIIERLQRLARSGETGDGLNPVQWEALRYVARANRFSRTPASLADYLASTRGTVSQTLIALEAKGLVEKTPSARDKRSLELSLTRQGRTALEHDPLKLVASDFAACSSDDLATIVDALRETLRRSVVRNGSKPFGVCRTCRHFRAGAGKSKPARGPHHCTLLDEPLSEEDSQAICAEQEPAAGR